jgi:aldehyde:ferredoxin oxidoreductase
MKMGERTVNMQRAFNAREGFTAAHDILPTKLFGARVGGPTDGVAVPRGQLEAAIRTYYQMAGWDEDGRLTRAKLDELGTGCIEDLTDSAQRYPSTF